MAAKKYKQDWPEKLTLEYVNDKSTRWVKKRKCRITDRIIQHKRTLPKELRETSRRKLEQHCRKTWKEWWLPLQLRLEAEEKKHFDRINGGGAADHWAFRMESIGRFISQAQRLSEGRELFVNLLVHTAIDEYQVKNGKQFSQEERQTIFESPQNYPHVFGFEAREDNPGMYQIPESRSYASTGTSIGELLDEYLEDRKAEVTVRTHKELRTCTVPFRDFAGTLDFESLTEQTIVDYRKAILARVQSKEIGDERGNNLVSAAKTFLRWCMKQSSLTKLIEPEVRTAVTESITGKGMGVKRGRKKVKLTDVATVRKYLDEETNKTEHELLALCAANFAMTPIDVSKVKWSNFSDGVLTWQREKEHDEENVPIVRYVVWQRTQEVLDKMPVDGEYVFGKATQTIDAIFRRAKNRAGIADLTMMMVKKCSSTLIGEQYDNDLADYFLDHAPRDIGRKHYIAPSDERLTKALRWLETVYFPEDGNTTGNTTGNTKKH